MNILTAGDFHQEEELKEGLVEEANTGGYGMFLGIGDYHTPEFYEDLVDSLEIPFLCTTGNWDFDFEPPENGEYPHLYNYKKVDFEDYKILLLGSVYPDDVIDQAEAFFDGADHSRRIVVSHYPPHMLGDLADNGNRAGFQEFRELLMRVRPALWTCGHIHEDFGKFALMDTTVLNAASAETGKAWNVEMGDSGVEKAEEVDLTG